MRAVAAAAALATLAVCAGCSDGGAPAGSPQQPPAQGREAQQAGERAALERLLERRAAALEGDDAGAFARTALGAQRRRDGITMRNRRGLPLRGVAYEVERASLEGRRAVLRATAAYRVRGLPSVFGSSRRLVARRHGAGWRIASERAPRDRFPWEVEAYRAERLPHFTVLAPAALDLGGLPAVLEEAYGFIGRRLVRPRPRPRYLVVVARDPVAAARLTGFIRGTGRLAAITDARVRDDGPAKRVTRVVALRLLVVQSAFAPLAAPEQLRVVAHELAHAVLTRRTSGRTPAWLGEGLALYLSEDRRVGQAAQLVTAGGSLAERRALTLTALSRPDAIARLAGDAQTAAYAYASAAAYYVAERFGEKRLLRLYSVFNDERVPGAGGPRTADAATRRVLRRPLAVLERDLRRWIVTRAVVDPFAP